MIMSVSLLIDRARRYLPHMPYNVRKDGPKHWVVCQNEAIGPLPKLTCQLVMNCVPGSACAGHGHKVVQSDTKPQRQAVTV
jgi:hypothetical protein